MVATVMHASEPVAATRADHGTGLTGLPVALLLSLSSLVWSAALITDFGFRLIAPEKLGMVFNDMALRLPHLDMTIDPSLISFEAFVRDGRAYAYFGIFPALLRLPAMWAGAAGYPLARISCLLALWITNFATVRLTQAALGSGPRTSAAKRIGASALIGVCFTGPVIYVLASASIYHEAIFWAVAWTAVFNCVVVRRTLAGEELGAADLVLLALAAGCALLTRVTAGVVLYAGLAVLMSRPVARMLIEQRVSRLAAAVRLAGPAALVAIAFVGIEAAVNDARWGNPLTAIPMNDYQQWFGDPHREEWLALLARHGQLDLTRVPISALYYGLGLKVDLLFPAVVREHFILIEGPRSPVLLCAPWLILCAAFGLWTAMFRRPRWNLVGLLAANALGFVMALALPWLCLRYTFDGWEFVALAAALGAGSLARRADAAGSRSRRIGQLAIALTLLGVVVSHAMLLRYKINYSGTTPTTRYWLSARIQPLLCPHAALTRNVQLSDFIPLVTPNCPPLW